jgi:hypothetical protein
MMLCMAGGKVGHPAALRRLGSLLIVAASDRAQAAEAQAAEAAARPVLQYEQYRGRFPFKIGKYWLGPMDPSKKWDPDDERFRGGYGYVCAGINSETGEHVCCKMNHNLEYEGTEEQRLEVSRAFPSWNRSILTEIYLCRACSYQ